MNGDEVCNKLSARIPLYTNGFSSTVDIVSISPSGSTGLVTTSTAHGLVEGQNIAIKGTETPVQIDISESLRTGTELFIKTIQNHDITLDKHDIRRGGKSVTISGAVEPELNGTFKLLEPPTRDTLKLEVPDIGPTTISGSPIINNSNIDIYNGFFQAENVTANTFEIALSKSYTVDAFLNDAKVHTSLRILQVLDVNRFIQDIYTAQNSAIDLEHGDYLVVQVGDVVISKDRSESTDASVSLQGNASKNVTYLQSFAVYVIMGITDLITGADKRNKIENEYAPAIAKSLMNAKFSIGFQDNNDYAAVMTSHGVFNFEIKGRALYVHEFVFEQNAAIDERAMADENKDVAFNTICLDPISTDLGTGEMTAQIDIR